eukprot:6580895-Prymnesium_polylepis.1
MAARVLRLLLRALLLGHGAALRLPPRPRTGGWPTSLRAHVGRGIARAVEERAAEGGALAGLRASRQLGWMVLSELVLFPAKMVPFAFRTVRYRKRIMREVQCGDLPHQILEVYDGDTKDGPLVLYVHGGSWGQGAPWNYALLANRLLSGGASRVAVARYRLFPEGDVDDMVADLEAALLWCEAEAERTRAAGGQKLRVTLAAQSAGAHLCALVFSRRSVRSAAATAWAPDRFVALSGVFDIAPHFGHEKTRL